MPRYNPVFENLPTYPQQALEQKKALVRSQGKKVLDFGIGDPIEPPPSFIPDALRNAIKPKCGYPKVKGDPQFRQSVSNYLQRRFGVKTNPDKNILPCSGSKEAVFHAPLLVIDAKAEDKTVIFPDPGYPAYSRGALFAGGEIHAVPLSGDFIFRPWTLPESLLRKTRLIWLNTPHNPSGAVMSLDDLQRTYDLCQDYDILCVSDECYADIYDSDPPHSLIECGLKNTIALHSLSKRSGMTGYRSAFMVGDEVLIEKYASLRSNPGVVPQTFVNAAATVAWADDAHVAERRDVFREKKHLFLRFFRELGWETVGEAASLYLWVKTPEGLSPDILADRLLDAGVVVSPGNMFAITPAGDHHIRLAMVPDLDSCRAAIQAFRKVIEEIQ